MRGLLFSLFVLSFYPLSAMSDEGVLQEVEVELGSYYRKSCRAIKGGLENFLNRRKFLPGVSLVGEVSCQNERSWLRGATIVRYTVSLEDNSVKVSSVTYTQQMSGPDINLKVVEDFFNDVIDRFAHEEDNRFCSVFDRTPTALSRQRYELVCN